MTLLLLTILSVWSYEHTLLLVGIAITLLIITRGYDDTR